MIKKLNAGRKIARKMIRNRVSEKIGGGTDQPLLNAVSFALTTCEKLTKIAKLFSFKNLIRFVPQVFFLPFPFPSLPSPLYFINILLTSPFSFSLVSHWFREEVLPWSDLLHHRRPFPTWIQGLSLSLCSFSVALRSFPPLSSLPLALCSISFNYEIRITCKGRRKDGRKRGGIFFIRWRSVTNSWMKGGKG